MFYGTTSQIRRAGTLKPSAFELFCMYHLGLTPAFRAKFFNLGSVARHYGVSSREVEAWLAEYRLQPELFRHVDFNLARAHADAQEIGLFGTAAETEAFARKTYERLQQSLPTYSKEKVFEDVDYDDLWGDKDGDK